MAKDQGALQLLQQVIDHQADDLVFSVQLKEVAEQLVAGIRIRATPEDEQRRIPELNRYTTGLGAHDPDAVGLRISHTWSGEVVNSEILVPLTQPIAGSEAITVHVFEMRMRYMLALHRLVDGLLGCARVDRLHGYECSGPPRELYLCPPASGQRPTYRTEVQ